MLSIVLPLTFAGSLLPLAGNKKIPLQRYKLWNEGAHEAGRYAAMLRRS